MRSVELTLMQDVRKNVEELELDECREDVIPLMEDVSRLVADFWDQCSPSELLVCLRVEGRWTP